MKPKSNLSIQYVYQFRYQNETHMKESSKNYF